MPPAQAEQIVAALRRATASLTPTCRSRASSTASAAPSRSSAATRPSSTSTGRSSASSPPTRSSRSRSSAADPADAASLAQGPRRRGRGRSGPRAGGKSSRRSARFARRGRDRDEQASVGAARHGADRPPRARPCPGGDVDGTGPASRPAHRRQAPALRRRPGDDGLLPAAAPLRGPPLSLQSGGRRPAADLGLRDARRPVGDRGDAEAAVPPAPARPPASLPTRLRCPRRGRRSPAALPAEPLLRQRRRLGP